MLVLSRRLNEKIVFPGIGTAVQVVAIKAGAVRLGIEAPPHVTVFREELRDRIAEWRPSTPPVADQTNLSPLLSGRLKVASTGIALLRRQLEAGRLQDAAGTLDKLEEDLAMLRQRLEKEERRPTAKKGTPHKALLVEDNANERELVALFLRPAGP